MPKTLGPSRAWTADELNVLRSGYVNGERAHDMARTLGRSYRSVSNKLHILIGEEGLVRTERRSPFQPQPPESVAIPTVRPVGTYEAPTGETLAETLAPEGSADEPEEVFLERMTRSAVRSVNKAVAQRHVRLRIASTEPVAISLTSDWHVSATGTDLPSLIAYADYVAHTPGLYAIGVGDLHDNAIKHKGGSVSGIMDELRFLDMLVGRFRGKLLGFTSGNHDDWSKTFSGVDNLLALAKRHKIHYAPDELLWTVEIVHPETREVTATYRIHTRHQWRRGSALNPCHACWTWWQEEGANWEHHPDVLAIGHSHVSAVESRQFAARDMWAARIGTFQIDSAFARAKGFGRYRSTCPTVVLPPTRADVRVQCFADPHDAVTFMRGLSDAT